jgi:hypothetical protein
MAHSLAPKAFPRIPPSHQTLVKLTGQGPLTRSAEDKIKAILKPVLSDVQVKPHREGFIISCPDDANLQKALQKNLERSWPQSARNKKRALRKPTIVIFGIDPEMSEEEIRTELLAKNISLNREEIGNPVRAKRSAQQFSLKYLGKHLRLWGSTIRSEGFSVGSDMRQIWRGSIHPTYLPILWEIWPQARGMQVFKQNMHWLWRKRPLILALPSQEQPIPGPLFEFPQSSHLGPKLVKGEIPRHKTSDFELCPLAIAMAKEDIGTHRLWKSV